MVALTALGFLSGLIGDFLLINLDKNIAGYVPALVVLFAFPVLFGIAIATYFKLPIKKYLAFILACIAAYLSMGIASLLAIFLGLFTFGFLGGAVEAAVLAYGVRGTLFPLSQKDVVVFAIAGGLLSTIGFIVGARVLGEGTLSNPLPAQYFVYLIWETGIAFMIGWFSKRKLS